MTHEQYLTKIDEVIANGKYKDNWQSLSNHKTPDWYYKGKFGIFIHWGIYSVPAFGGEWYSRNMYNPERKEFEYHVKNFGPHSKFGYKDFIPMFRGEHFDAGRWVDLFREAGAKFVVPVCEHHDGFAMYDTEFNRWNAAKMGPCVNYAGEMKKACEERGLTFCASSHRAEHYFFMNMGRVCDSDVNDDNYRDFYGPAYYSEGLHGDNMPKFTEDIFTEGPTEEWMQDWLVRTCELIDRYQPKLLYFDWWIQNIAFKPYLKKLVAFYYNRAEEWGEEVTIDFKHDAIPPTVATFDVERGGLNDINPYPWQTDTAIGVYSWGYTQENEYKKPYQLITDIIDTVSKNGMFLLNIGPKSDGTFTQEETDALVGIGKWMKKNGEGIYETTFWKKFGEGETKKKDGYFNEGLTEFNETDFRFTYKDGYIYAFQLKPDGKDACITSLGLKGRFDTMINTVTLLSTGKKLDFERKQEALVIKADDGFDSEYSICFKIELG